jgi:uncharacterized membrane protein
MTRDEFLKRLGRGLSGMPADEVADIIGDYEAHFDAAAEDGRSEAEVAKALGDPARIARELRLEAGIRRWQEVRSPSSAWAAVIAFIGLGAIDIIVLLPLLLSVIGVMIGLYVAVIGVFIVGGVAMIAGPFSSFPGGSLVALLTGLGVMSAAIFAGALLVICTIWLINALMWFGRLHYRVIQPAIDPDA